MCFLSYIVSRGRCLSITKNNFKFLYNDLVFKFIFGTTDNKIYLQHFLKLLFDSLIGSFRNIQILNSVKLIPGHIKTRKLEMDVFVSIPSISTKVILEMQTELNVNTLSKNIVYLFSQIPKEFKSGDSSFIDSFNVKEFIFVKHSCECLEGLDDVYHLTGKKCHKVLLDNIIDISIIELDKYVVKCYNKSTLELHLWFMLINADSFEKLDEIWKLSKSFPLLKEVIIKMKEFQESLYGNDYWLNDVLIRSENKRHYIEGSIEGSKKGAKGKQY